MAKHTHDGKLLEVSAAARGQALDGVASDSMLAAYLLDASRTRYELDDRHPGRGPHPHRPAHGVAGTGRTAAVPPS
jgi:DNA polymerase I-like protein with 3'-5' exonuclease and polymerase domains